MSRTSTVMLWHCLDTWFVFTQIGQQSTFCEKVLLVGVDLGVEGVCDYHYCMTCKSLDTFFCDVLRELQVERSGLVRLLAFG